MSRSKKPEIPYDFSKCKKYPPPRPRVRPPYQPWRIDTRRFLADKVRPFPEWPLICKESMLLAFDTEGDAKAWNNKYSPQAGIFKLWLCAACQKYHYEAFPLEPSGGSSGKAVRKWDFLRKKGIEHS